MKQIINETFDNLNKLEELDLSGNIIEFSVDNFSGLEESLKSLKLRNMTLQYLPLEALSTLENLQELDASFNNFTNITRNFFKGISVKTFNLTSCNISKIHHHAFQDFNKTNLILDGNPITDLAFLYSLSHSAFGNLTLNENGFNCSALEHKVRSVVFETLEGYCTVGNETRQLSAYFTEELNMKLRSSSGNIRLNRELVVLLTAFISMIIGICVYH